MSIFEDLNSLVDWQDAYSRAVSDREQHMANATRGPKWWRRLNLHYADQAEEKRLRLLVHRPTR